MGEDWGSWFPQQQIEWQSSNLNCLGSQIGMGKQYTVPTIVNPATDMIAIKGTSSAYQPHEQLHSCVGQANEPRGWFYGLPQFQQAFMPTLNYGFEGKFPTAPCDNGKESVSLKLDPGCGRKKFLVFDQSGDQTTLIFGPGMRTPVENFTPLGANATGTCNLKIEEPVTKANLNIHLGALAADQYTKESGPDLLSEMHEDTDELNALLYSDDDSDYGEDDEVTSTGHSPSTMTVHNKQNWFEEGPEGAGSCNGLIKKRKLFEGYSDLSALMDTASSVKRTGCSEYGDDAESRCDNDKSRAWNNLVSEPNHKKRKDKIRETVNILENIIPCGKGKDAVVVIDEAINYLKSLKLKAKALGLDAP